MAQVFVKVTEREEERSFVLDESTALLLGRAPDPHAVLDTSEVGGRTLVPAPIVVPSVSANHALVWSEAGAVCLKDLGSRNGTWLRVPRGETVRVNGDVAMHLARGAGDGAGADEPAHPSWDTRAQFAGALAKSIGDWLGGRGLQVRVTVVPKGMPGSGGCTSIPLASGDALDVIPLATADATWSRTHELLWRWVARQNTLYDTEEATRREGIILASGAVRSAHREVIEVARSKSRTLLLTGPSGAGKERFAEVFHLHSERSGPFVALNCGMFSKDLLRSELFGAEVGSFSGATRRIIGAVKRAEGGTLFLDEIGEMPMDLQPMLLRFLDRHEYEPLGAYGNARKADVTVVAATNRDLRGAERAGRFRADLWYRLSVHVVEVPPLRARWDDVIAFLDSIPLDGGRGSMRDALSPEALEILRTHPWDGNFRELANFAQRLPRHDVPGGIDAATCRSALERGSLRPLASGVSSPPPAGGTTEWAELASRAVQAFVDDHDHEPATWDEQKEWNEKYLKPLLFYRLSGASGAERPANEDAFSTLASQTASRVRADRGTAAKQLTRYFDRFLAPAVAPTKP